LRSSPAALGVVVLEAADLTELRLEWESLAARCPGHYLFQTWRWAATAWHIVAAPRGRTLHILTMRSEGRLVAIWPLVAYRDGCLRIVRQLSAEGSEYISPLVEPGAGSAERLESLWRAACPHGDVLLLPFVRGDGPFAAFLRSHGARSFRDNVIKAPWIDLRSYPDWSSYSSTVSHSHLRGLTREYRRLGKEGEVAFRVEDPDAIAPELERMLASKDHWMVRRSRFNEWLRMPDYRAFLAAMSSGTPHREGLTLFTVRLDGVQIAAELSAVDGTRVEALVRTYDPKWSRRSPGDILLQEVMRWAFERGLDYDFRLGNESYKAKWTRNTADVFTCRVGLNLRGLMAVWFWRLGGKVQRMRMRLGLGRFIRPLARAAATVLGAENKTFCQGKDESGSTKARFSDLHR
jgi:CelD/BcsL family acetyltransferase involved in cellulose biosynthesis